MVALSGVQREEERDEMWQDFVSFVFGEEGRLGRGYFCRCICAGFGRASSVTMIGRRLPRCVKGRNSCKISNNQSVQPDV